MNDDPERQLQRQLDEAARTLSEIEQLMAALRRGALYAQIMTGCAMTLSTVLYSLARLHFDPSFDVAGHMTGVAVIVGVVLLVVMILHARLKAKLPEDA